MSSSASGSAVSHCGCDGHRAMLSSSCTGRGNVIYLIYKDGEILVETDDLEFARSYVTKNEECSVRDARTGKKVTLE